MLEDTVLFTKIEEGGIRQHRRVRLAPPVERSKGHQSARVGIRERLEHDRVEHREDGSGGADPQRQGQGGRGRESL